MANRQKYFRVRVGERLNSSQGPVIVKAPMTPTRIEYDLGSNVHGQPVRLVREQTTGRGPAWTIYRDEADQRDDRSNVGGLTRDQILRMAEAVRQHP